MNFPKLSASDLRFQRVAVLLHPYRVVEGDLERSLLPSLAFLQERAEVFLDSSFVSSPEIQSKILALGVRLGERSAIIAGCDLIITFGGDGSLIAAASEVQNAWTCLLGINAGNLGFLTEGSLEEGPHILRAICAGRGWLDRRMKLNAVVHRAGERMIQWDAINDVVIRQGTTNSLLELEASIDGVELITYRADGVVCSTPSGSTAYALSAGGPIVHPSLHCIEVAPIAAFTLSARPIVIPADGVIQFQVISPHHDATITFDGQKVFSLWTGDRIEIRASQVPVNFIRVKHDDFYRTLREKLGWHHERS
jgi:NAD+ kinase